MDYTNLFDSYTLPELRSILTELGGAAGNKKKSDLIAEIMAIRAGKVPTRSKRGRPSTKKKRASASYSGTLITEQNVVAWVRDVSMELDGAFEVEGYFEPMPEGGYLRAINNYPNVSDPYISKKMAEKYYLRCGDKIVADAAVDTENKLNVVKKIRLVNGTTARTETAKSFESFKNDFTAEKITLSDGVDPALRLVDVMCPFSKGQRGVLIAGSGTGKTFFIKKLVKTLTANDKNLKVVVALPDERPEDVAFYLGEETSAEYFYSTFEHTVAEHIYFTEMAFNHAKCLAEDGNDVVLLLDSATKLMHAYITEWARQGVVPEKEREILTSQSAGVIKALAKLKQLFTFARKTESGSITLFATVDPDDNYFYDKSVESAFVSVANMLMYFDCSLATKRVYPPIDFSLSRRKNIESLLSEDDLAVYDAAKLAVTKYDGASEQIINIFSKHAFSADLKDEITALTKIK